MYKMSDFNRAPSKVLKQLVKQKDTSMYCKVPCSIIVPKDWLNTRLCQVDNAISVVGILMLKVGKDYTVWNIPSTLELGMCEPEVITIDKVECLEFKYGAGEIVVKELMAPVSNTLPYVITDNIVKKGSVVPYLTYDDFLTIPLNFPYYCSLRIPEVPYANIYMGYVCRMANDPRKRASLSKDNSYLNIPLNAVHLSVENTTNRISGGYLDPSIQSALLNKTDKASMSEIILRS